MNRHLIAMAAIATLLWSQPALAQDIDLSAVDSLLQSILDALTGTTGRTVMTIVAVFVLLGGAFNFIDWARVFTLLIIIVIIGVIPTVIQSIWGATT
ncbi:MULTISPECIES: TrbC/VirB2 family protein [Roseobacteraceae]|uniref:TrbC/VirB2 family protein n=1 Tax=Roseobacteraceae TaxID=2854170 RepID=UPI0022CB43EC|nr:MULTISPECIES: TrbC/VirB2 family protein [Roseobacteraceae]MCZ4354779.1 TrbC/VirB2 family protein [Roseovarius aestuarii]